MLGDRWRILVLREAFYGVRRYGEMVRNLGIARNVLSLRLKTLVADGLLERRRYRIDPDWYEYVLTDAGRDLYGTILATLHWADRHALATGNQQLRLRHLACGELTHAEVVCAVCGKTLDPREVRPEPSERT
jgi:DNA-binding HxlR family transcriptional regulator